MQKYDLLIQNAQLRDRPEERYDIGISSGKIAALFLMLRIS